MKNKKKTFNFAMYSNQPLYLSRLVAIITKRGLQAQLSLVKIKI